MHDEVTEAAHYFITISVSREHLYQVKGAIEASLSYLTPPVNKNCKGADWVTNFCYCRIDHFFVIDLDNPLYSTQLAVSCNS